MAVNNYCLGLILTSLLPLCSFAAENIKEEELSVSFKESRRIFSYTQGHVLGASMSHHTTAMDIESFLNGIRDAYQKRKNPFSMLQIASASQVVQPLLKRAETAMQKQGDLALLQENLQKEKDFLEKNTRKSGVRTSPSTLQWRSMMTGSGKMPKKGDRLLVHYQARLLDGSVFERSAKGKGQELVYDALIPGLKEGLQNMREGGTAEFYIPHNLAYGKNSRGMIAPGSLVIYYVTLEKILLPAENQVKTTKN